MAKSSIRFERSFGVLIPGISRHSSMKRDNLPITNGMIARVTRLDRFRSARFDWRRGREREREKREEEKKEKKKKRSEGRASIFWQLRNNKNSFSTVVMESDAGNGGSRINSPSYF